MKSKSDTLGRQAQRSEATATNRRRLTAPMGQRYINFVGEPFPMEELRDEIVVWMRNKLRRGNLTWSQGQFLIHLPLYRRQYRRIKSNKYEWRAELLRRGLRRLKEAELREAALKLLELQGQEMSYAYHGLLCNAWSMAAAAIIREEPKLGERIPIALRSLLDLE